ncbi:MAG TPA: sigma 54-interacting transcriptional regulator, partial [Edaphobacter sp.]|nr:sigma 54-interacting transcriptional regulator [Edaphobacter sp.]
MSISRSAFSCVAVPPGPGTPSINQEEFEIVGSSEAMKRLRLQVRRIGPHFRSVLVSGEAGTGKEWVARALHGMGRPAGGPFVVCHAAAIEDAPVEFEASMGPVDTITRLMKRAQRGTLFLD